MSDEWTQTSAFPEIVPEAAQRAAETSEPVPVPRAPGWVLVATRGGPTGFHRVKTVGNEGSVRTLCGLTGRVISENERAMVPCPACQAGSPA